MDVDKLIVPQIIEELKSRGLSTKGNKPELVARLKKALEEEAMAEVEAEAEDENEEDDEEGGEASNGDGNHNSALSQAEKAAAAAAAAVKPRKAAPAFVPPSAAAAAAASQARDVPVAAAAAAEKSRANKPANNWLKAFSAGLATRKNGKARNSNQQMRESGALQKRIIKLRDDAAKLMNRARMEIDRAQRYAKNANNIAVGNDGKDEADKDAAEAIEKATAIKIKAEKAYKEYLRERQRYEDAQRKRDPFSYKKKKQPKRFGIRTVSRYVKKRATKGNVTLRARAKWRADEENRKKEKSARFARDPVARALWRLKQESAIIRYNLLETYPKGKLATRDALKATKTEYDDRIKRLATLTGIKDLATAKDISKAIGDIKAEKLIEILHKKITVNGAERTISIDDIKQEVAIINTLRANINAYNVEIKKYTDAEERNTARNGEIQEKVKDLLNPPANNA